MRHLPRIHREIFPTSSEPMGKILDHGKRDRNHEDSHDGCERHASDYNGAKNAS